MRIHLSPPLPTQQLFENPDGEFKQAAGHPGTIIRTDHGTVIKEASERERAFYRLLVDHPQLAKLCPAYFGEQPINNGVGVELIDLTEPFVKPCVIDIKMGTKTWDEESSDAKRQRASGKDALSTTASLGFRICGSHVFDCVENSYRNLPKDEALLISAQEMPQALCDYFWNGQELRSEWLSPLLEQLAQVQKWFEQNDSLIFTASSLLLIYEGDRSVEDPAPPSLSMIDFAHVIEYEPPCPDEGYLLGLENLATMLASIEG